MDTGTALVIRCDTLFFISMHSLLNVLLVYLSIHCGVVESVAYIQPRLPLQTSAVFVMTTVGSNI